MPVGTRQRSSRSSAASIDQASATSISKSLANSVANSVCWLEWGCSVEVLNPGFAEKIRSAAPLKGALPTVVWRRVICTGPDLSGTGMQQYVSQFGSFSNPVSSSLTGLVPPEGCASRTFPPDTQLYYANCIPRHAPNLGGKICLYPIYWEINHILRKIWFGYQMLWNLRRKVIYKSDGKAAGRGLRSM
jgi:hypothetical protein